MNNGVSACARKRRRSADCDNIANVNTAGFKYQRALFEDVFSRASRKRVGAGVS
jgi:flagellar hook protein FlgE